MKTHKNSKERGNAMLEFALGWSVVWLIFSGVYQFGYSFYTYNVLMTAVANAAQLGAKIDYDTATPSNFTDALKNMVVYGDESTGTTPVLPGLGTGNVNVLVTVDSANMPQYVTVSVTGYTINTFFNSWTLSGKPRATTAYFGRVACSTC